MIPHARHPGPAEGRRLLLRAPIRPRTCSTRSASSAASTARARQIAGRGGRATDDEVGAVHRQHRAHRQGLPAPALARRRSRRSRISTRRRSASRRFPAPCCCSPPRRCASSRSASSTTSATCEEPRGKYLIIDGQHRLAALHFYRKQRPDEAKTHPRAVRDLRRQERGLRHRDVRHHQLDADAHQQEPPRRSLRARLVGRARQEVRGAASSSMLYGEGDSPLRYRINRLGGRSTAGEVDPAGRAVQRDPPLGAARLARRSTPARQRAAATRERYYEMVRDFLKAAEKVWGDAWGNAELHGHPAGHAQGDAARLRRPLRARTPSPTRARRSAGTQRLAPWAEQQRELPRRGLLRALPRQGPGRARRPHPPRARALRRHHGEAAEGRRGVRRRRST